MVSLSPMSAEAFPAFFEQAVLLFASENVAAGRWTEQGSIERSRLENTKLLTEGIASPGQFLFEICAAEHRGQVGYLWLAPMPRGSTKFAFVVQVFIKPEHRRSGYASSALRAAESFALGQGLSGIGLHVFAHNSGARALYQSLGYAVTSSNMFKPLSSDA